MCKALVIFLKSRRGVNFAETSLDRYKAHEREYRGGGPARHAGIRGCRDSSSSTSRACTACHKLGDRDGGIAPDLSFEGLIRDDAWMLDHFQNPRSRMPDSIMPSFRFPAEDFQHLTDLSREPEDAAAAGRARRDVQGPVRALPWREGRRPGQGRVVSRPLAARLHESRRS